MREYTLLNTGKNKKKERKSYSLDPKGLVNRHRLAMPIEAGGLKIIIPSVMFRAIRTNMVSRALSDRGRWWCQIFLYWCESAGGGLFFGPDALLQRHKATLKQLTANFRSPFWTAAIKDWLKLQYQPDPAAASMVHREHAASHRTTSCHLVNNSVTPTRGASVYPASRVYII